MGKKIFYTERDIKDLADQGVTQLEIHDDVVLTDLARERAFQLGLRLIPTSPAGHPEDSEQAELIHRVKAAVIARLGDQVDAGLLETVVNRVAGGRK